MNDRLPEYPPDIQEAARIVAGECPGRHNILHRLKHLEDCIYVLEADYIFARKMMDPNEFPPREKVEAAIAHLISQNYPEWLYFGLQAQLYTLYTCNWRRTVLPDNGNELLEILELHASQSALWILARARTLPATFAFGWDELCRALLNYRNDEAKEAIKQAYFAMLALLPLPNGQRPQVGFNPARPAQTTAATTGDMPAIRLENNRLYWGGRVEDLTDAQFAVIKELLPIEGKLPSLNWTREIQPKIKDHTESSHWRELFRPKAKWEWLLNSERRGYLSLRTPS